MVLEHKKPPNINPTLEHHTAAYFVVISTNGPKQKNPDAWEAPPRLHKRAESKCWSFGSSQTLGDPTVKPRLSLFRCCLLLLVASSISRATFCLFTRQMQPSRCCRSHKLHKDQLPTSKKPFSLNSTIIILIITSRSHQTPQHLLCNMGRSRQQSHRLRRHALFPLAAQPKKERIKKEIRGSTTESSQR